MSDANEILIEALLDDVLDQDIVHDAVEEAIDVLRGTDPTIGSTDWIPNSPRSNRNGRGS